MHFGIAAALNVLPDILENIDLFTTTHNTKYKNMTIRDKLAMINEKELHLHKEGIFWIAYNEDAYRVSQVKRLKPTRKYIKSISCDIVCVGFPSASLDGILSHFVVTERNETMFVASVNQPLDKVKYEEWKNGIELLGSAQKPQEPFNAPVAGNALVEAIASFKLHQASPMDCMRFIEKLQEEYC